MEEDFVLKPSVDYETLEVTLPELLLQKAKEHAEDGKEVWIVGNQ